MYNSPLPLLLHCPLCNARHVDKGVFATKAHHTHACQQCGHVWRPALVPTVGVQFLPGFRDGEEECHHAWRLHTTVTDGKLDENTRAVCDKCGALHPYDAGNFRTKQV